MKHVGLLCVIGIMMTVSAFSQGLEPMRLGDSDVFIELPEGFDIFEDEYASLWTITTPEQSVKGMLTLGGDPSMLVGIAMLSTNTMQFSVQIDAEIQKYVFDTYQGKTVVKHLVWNSEQSQAILFYTVWTNDSFLNLTVAGTEADINTNSEAFDALCSSVSEEGENYFESSPRNVSEGGFSFQLPERYHVLSFPENTDMAAVIDEEMEHLIFIGGVMAESEEDTRVISELRQSIRTGVRLEESFEKLIDKMQFDEETGITLHSEDIEIIPGLDPTLYIPIGNTPMLEGTGGSFFLNFHEDAVVYAMTVGNENRDEWPLVHDILVHTEIVE